MPDVDPTLAPPSARLLRLPELPASMGYGEEHELLRRSARRWLDEKSNLSSVRRLVDDPVGFDPALVLETWVIAGWPSVGLSVEPRRPSPRSSTKRDRNVRPSRSPWTSAR